MVERLELEMHCPPPPHQFHLRATPSPPPYPHTMLGRAPSPIPPIQCWECSGRCCGTLPSFPLRIIIFETGLCSTRGFWDLRETRCQNIQRTPSGTKIVEQTPRVPLERRSLFMHLRRAAPNNQTTARKIGNREEATLCGPLISGPHN